MYEFTADETAKIEEKISQFDFQRVIDGFKEIRDDPREGGAQVFHAASRDGVPNLTECQAIARACLRRAIDPAYGDDDAYGCGFGATYVDGVLKLRWRDSTDQSSIVVGDELDS